MKKILVFVVTCFSIFATAKAQDASLFEKKSFISNGDTMPYRILLPLNFDKSKKYPLVIFLHGSGERGNDNEKQLVHGGDLFLTESLRQNYPAIVVFPQCSESSFWANVKSHFDTIAKKRTIDFMADAPPSKAMNLLMELFKQLKKDYKLDNKKLYVGGLSMGGMGTFELVYRMPDSFAAAFAICGGADTLSAKKMTKTAWWIFHGLKDPVVDPQLCINMADALKAAGASVKITLYPDDGHNSWDSVFKEPGLFPWIFSHKK